MALIKCPECGKEISDNAQFCPNCGCPIQSKKKEQEKMVPETGKKEILLSSAKTLNKISLIVFSVLLIFAVISFTGNREDSNAVVTEQHTYTMIFGVGAIETTPEDGAETEADLRLEKIGVFLTTALIMGVIALVPVNYVIGRKINETLSEKLVKKYSIIAGISFALVLFPTFPIILMSFGLYGFILIPSILQILASRKYRAALLE